MAFVPFETCRLRSDRAGAHGKTLAELWNSRNIRKAYTTRIDFQDDGTGEIFITPVEPDWFVEFALLYGEMLYQFRAALDSLIYDAAILVSGQNPPPNKRALMFPICSDSEKFKEAENRIAPLPNELKAFIEAVQPYNGKEVINEFGLWKIGETLGVIGEWSIDDRHRTLHLVGSYPKMGNIEIIPPEGMTVNSLEFEGAGTLEHENKIGTCKIGNFRRGAKLHMKTDIVFEIAIDEGGGSTVLVTRSAQAMLICVWEILGNFKKHFGIK